MLRRLTAAALAATALAAAGLVAAPAHAAPARTPSCDPGDCFTVSVRLDLAPAVGQTATLTVEVTAKEDLPDATTTIELPETLRWVRPPAGLDRRAATIGRSRVDRASRTERARKGARVRYEGVVTAVAPGPASIRVQARDGRPGPGSEGLVYLTVGAESSIFGMPPGSAKPHTRTQPLVQTASLVGDTCVHGQVTHVTLDAVVRGTPSTLVEAWDVDAGGAEYDKLGATLTDDAGNYRICFTGTEENGSGQDVDVQVLTEGRYWRIVDPTDNDNVYWANGSVHKDIPPGDDRTVDVTAPPGTPVEDLLRIMAAAHDTWDFYIRQLQQPDNDCWRPGEAVCRTVTFKWAPTRVVTSSYCSFDPCRFQIDLDASVGLEKMTVAHELGHFIMDYTYGHLPPRDPACSVHYVTSRSTESCAWVEGWAHWISVQTYGDTHIRWKPTDGTVDVESPTWFSAGWDDGPDVEGRVTAALLDLADNHEEIWDTGSIGTHGVVAAFRKAPADTFAQFLAGLKPEDQALAESVAFQNTIRGSRTEDLDDRTTVRRLANVPLQSVFSSTTGRWSVVAAATSGAGSGDVTLEVNPLEGGSTVRSSQGLGPDPDFVAVQPTLVDQIFASRVSSGVDLREYVLQNAVAPPGDLERGTPQTFTMPADQLVEIRTTPIDLGAFVTFTVTPQNGQDIDLYVMAPNSTAWGLARSAARRSSTGGPGKAERITIADPKVPGVYAVIVVRKSGDGDLTLTRT
ncbi:hypothetical protein DI270_017590 [Microbispora triticiradicis]|uniref:Uncharacterized protein n=1 Tax=Microbispora triticiradicis TaxID=2200763 RepID=A0ABX9LIF9_9ACTN|nr:hypothetical protein [Microbispora triticiradicis]RGA03695.1 hypothetical protein DI270_017590 [Microbispora triticiradicis]